MWRQQVVNGSVFLFNFKPKKKQTFHLLLARLETVSVWQCVCVFNFQRLNQQNESISFFFFGVFFSKWNVYEMMKMVTVMLCTLAVPTLRLGFFLFTYSLH